MYFAVLCLFLVHSTIAGEVGILNGDTASEGQFPWQVGVFGIEGDDLLLTFCSGAIISEEWILTSAGCVTGFNDNITVVAGVVTLETVFQNVAAEVIAHEDYNASTLLNNIAVLRLETKLVFDNLTQAVELDDQVLDGGVVATVAGWGAINDINTNISYSLQYAELTTMTNEDCVSVFGSEVVTDDILCAIGEDPLRNPCQNDGGAALVTGADTDTPKHVGIFSFMNAHGCTAHFPTGYIRTASYRDWIKEKTGI